MRGFTKVDVHHYGNVYVICAYMLGLPAEQIEPDKLGFADPSHPMVTVAHDVVRIDRAFYDRDLLMVMEPYPNADKWFENPSLLASNDGLHWLVPEGVSNPVVEPPPHRGAWNSDGDLVISGDGRLFLYYRHNSGKGESTLLRKETADGVHWSAPQIIFTRRHFRNLCLPRSRSPRRSLSHVLCRHARPVCKTSN
jgi:hypothetical protein